MSIKNVWR